MRGEGSGGDAAVQSVVRARLGVCDIFLLHVYSEH